MTSKDWFKIVILAFTIVFLIIGLNIYLKVKEEKWGKEKTVLVQQVEARKTEVEKAREAALLAQHQTAIVKEASEDYSIKLKKHFEDSHARMRMAFAENLELMKANYEEEMKKFKLKTTVTLNDAKVTVVLQDSTKHKDLKSSRETHEQPIKTFLWKDRYLFARVMVQGDSATIMDYNYYPDLLFRVREVPGTFRRPAYKVVEVEAKNPKAHIKAEDRQLIIEDNPNFFQRVFGRKKPNI